MTDLYDGMWVKCADRMPPEGVAVWTRVAGSSQAFLLKWERGAWRFLGTGRAIEADNITHWLDPTPQPSKLDELAELVRESDVYYSFRVYSELMEVTLFARSTSVGLHYSIDDAIYHLRHGGRVTRAEALEAFRDMVDSVSLGDACNIETVRRFLEQESDE